MNYELEKANGLQSNSIGQRPMKKGNTLNEEGDALIALAPMGLMMEHNHPIIGRCPMLLLCRPLAFSNS